MKHRKIVIAGGTGFLGQAIINKFKPITREIIVLTRHPKSIDGNVQEVFWDAQTLGKWAETLEGADAIINLTGRSINCRHNEQNRKEITESRVNATTILGKAIEQLKQAPKLWINASAANLYRDKNNAPNDESNTEYGNEFMDEVSIKWENALNTSNTPQTRKIIMRITLILGNGGGVFPVLKNLTKKGLGGKAGDGSQYMSSMHEDDFVNAIEWFISNEKLNGVFNMASPEPITNSSFMKLLRKKLKVPFGLPSPVFAIKIGAFFMQTEPGLVLKSIRVVPKKLLDSGFTFKYPTTAAAIDNLIEKQRVN
jgi:uncharacterized protein (TIGR01777 family)